MGSRSGRINTVVEPYRMTKKIKTANNPFFPRVSEERFFFGVKRCNTRMITIVPPREPSDISTLYFAPLLWKTAPTIMRMNATRMVLQFFRRIRSWLGIISLESSS